MTDHYGPKVTTALYEAGAGQLYAKVRDRLISRVENALRGELQEVKHQVRRAYMNGLKDGFAQGAASTCGYCKGAGIEYSARDLDKDDGYCELRACPRCQDGRRLGRSDVPIISGVEGS